MTVSYQPQHAARSEWMDVRDAVMQAIIELGARDERVVVLDADVSKSTRSRMFGQQYPERFFNVGIAEMHMASMAAALAADGLIPFIGSFATFLSMRALEPVRTQIVYPQLPVVLLGGYSGLSAMQHGPTHQCISDAAIMGAMPGMTVLSPADSVSAADFAVLAAAAGKPVYLRLGYHKQRIVYRSGDVKIGSVYLLREGADALILGTGLSTGNALDAAERLAADGVRVAVADVPTLKPFPSEDIAALASGYAAVITVEEHLAAGGLYALTCAALNEAGVVARVHGVNTGDSFAESAPYPDLLKKFGLDAEGIARRVMSSLNKAAR